MNHLDLFSGIGGFGLAANWAGYTTIGFCEVDPWCRRVLAKNWPEVPMYDDIKTLTGDIVRGWAGGQQVDLLTGGFPCQPVSVAGLRLGKEDDRYLWPEMLRLIADVRPARVLGENVAGIVTMGLDAVLSDLEALGYTCWPVVIPAAAVGAPHRRDRVWILADARRRNDARWSDATCGDDRDWTDTGRPEGSGWANKCGEDVADSAARGVRRGGSSGQPGLAALGGEDVSGSDGGRFEQRDAQERRLSVIDQNSDGFGHSRETLGGVDSNTHGISAELVGFGGLDGTTSIARSDEALPEMRGSLRAKDVQRALGGPRRIQTPEVLLGGMLRGIACQRCALRYADILPASAEVPWDALRVVWGYDQAASASLRQRSLEQLAREYPDVVYLLSRFPPPPCSTCWADGSWESDLTRTTTHEPDRTNKLKALGNAVVPQIPYEILKAWDQIGADNGI